MRITKQFEFSMGHVLFNYEGKCNQLHGHNYQLEVTVESDELDASGFVMDFSDLKSAGSKVLDAELDQEVWVYVKGPRVRALVDLGARSVAFEPTAENIIIYLKKAITDELPDSVILARLELYETSTSKAVLE